MIIIVPATWTLKQMQIGTIHEFGKDETTALCLTIRPRRIVIIKIVISLKLKESDFYSDR